MFPDLPQAFFDLTSSPHQLIKFPELKTDSALFFEIFLHGLSYLPRHHQSNQIMIFKVYLEFQFKDWPAPSQQLRNQRLGRLFFGGGGSERNRSLFNRAINLSYIEQEKKMRLHQHTLSLDLERQHNRAEVPLILRDVVRKTNEHQIRQHIPMVPISLPLQLKMKTKKALGKTWNTLVPTKANPRETLETPGETKRGMTSWSKSRGDSRLNETKRQLQLLSNLYKQMGRDQIKRYQEQLEHQESQIHRTVATYHFRRTSMHYRNPPPSRQSIEKEGRSLDLKPQQISATKQISSNERQPENAEMEPTLEKYTPYRRLLVNRRKSKGKVSPWAISQPTQPN